MASVNSNKSYRLDHYFTLEKKIEDIWTIKEKLGEGSSGIISRICKGDDCKYILKVIPFNDPTYQQQYMKEVTYYNLLGKIKPSICPKIHFYCVGERRNKKYGLLILDKMDKSLSDEILEFAKTDNIKGLLARLKQAKKILKTLERLGLSHNDAHIGNWMIKGKKIQLIDLDCIETKPSYREDVEQLLHLSWTDDYSNMTNEDKLSIEQFENKYKSQIVDVFFKDASTVRKMKPSTSFNRLDS